LTATTTPPATVPAPRTVRGTPPLRPRAKPIGGIGPLVLSASTAPALARLIVHGTSARVLLPLLVAIVLADAVVALTLRPRINVVLAFGLGWLVAVVGLVVAVDPSLFDPASAHFLHTAVLSTQLRAAHYALANEGTPLPLLNGVAVAVGLMGAAASALTRVIWTLQRENRPAALGRPRTLLLCLAPSCALFVYSTLVSAEKARVAAVVTYLLGVLVFVLPGGDPGGVGPRSSPARWRGAWWRRPPSSQPESVCRECGSRSFT
jgi:hypothetical protein